MALAVGAISSFGAMKILRRFSVLDVPNARSSHLVPTVRGGGIGVMAGAISGWALWPGRPHISVVLFASVLGVVGLVDDVRGGIRPSARLAIQSCAALVGSYWLVHLLHLSTWSLVLGVAGASFWMVAYVNAFNFMDGINGVSVVQTVVASGAWELALHVHGDRENVLPVVVAAAALAFLPFNAPRARMFLGDVGSYFLGAWLAETSILLIVLGMPVLTAVAPLCVYGSDTGTALVRRIRAHEDLGEAHRGHVYQRLVDVGWGHTATAVTVGAFCAAASACGLLALHRGAVSQVSGWAGVAVCLIAYEALPMRLAPRLVPQDTM